MAICVLFNSSSASGQKRNLLYRQLFARMGLYEPCGRVNQGFALQEAVVNVDLENSVKDAVSHLAQMNVLLASRVGLVGDERMPSTQVFQRVESLAARFNSIVGDLERLVITRQDASALIRNFDAILLEMRRHTLVLEAISQKLHEPPAPKGKRKS